jgi:hypothetical protein
MSRVAGEATGKKFLWLHLSYKCPTFMPGCLTDTHNTIQYIPSGKDDLRELGFLDVNGTDSG